MKRIFVLLVSTLLLAGCATPPPAPEGSIRGNTRYVQKYLAWLIEREMKENDITGISIALVDDQQVLWQQGFGYADLENRIPAAPETVYRAGSIAKVFTAAAAMQLAEQGKINIDRPLADALPEFSIRSRYQSTASVTPRNIMCHHSGLPSNFLRGLYVRDPDDFTKVVGEMRNEYLAFPPNYVFSYSNLGMALLGAAIQKVSGDPFDAYMAKHFFAPLGMTQSSFAARPIAKAYDRNKETEVFSLRDMPAANLLSNVVDLSRFLRMQFADGRIDGKQVISPASLREMVTIQNKSFPLTFGQYVGLGWLMSGIDVPGGGPVASHGGSLPDSHSMMAILPDHKLGVVVLSNSATSHVAVSKIAAESLRLMLEAKTGIDQASQQTARAPERAPTQTELDQFEGYFDTMVGLAKISGRSGAIDAEVAGHQFRLTPHEDGLFSIKYRLFGMMAVRVGAFEDIRLRIAEADGRQVVVGRVGGEVMVFGEKLKLGAIPEAFRQGLGKYEIIDKIDGPSPSSMLLKEEDGMLVGEATFKEVPDLLLRIAFQPVSDNEVVAAGVGTGRGDTLRIFEAGNEKRLLFSGIQMRRKLN